MSSRIFLACQSICKGSERHGAMVSVSPFSQRETPEAMDGKELHAAVAASAVGHPVSEAMLAYISTVLVTFLRQIGRDASPHVC